MPKTPNLDTLGTGKKILTSFVLFLFFLTQIVSFPFIAVSQAFDGSFKQIISLLVDEETYQELDNEIEAYGKNVSGSFPQSQTIIYRIASGTSPYKIASLQEKLYYEGANSQKGRLIGTVIIGSVPLPVVHDTTESYPSVYPYVDFQDKVFIYQETSGRYSRSEKTQSVPSPEIWHGLLVPNTGSKAQNIQSLRDFFQKSEEYYSESGRFSVQNTSPEPSIFYYDANLDEQGLQYSGWRAYQLYLSNLESLVYHRFSKHLAKKLYTEYQASQSQGGSIDINALPAELQGVLTKMNSGIQFDSIPDIQTPEIIKKTTKQFFEIINPTLIGQILRYAYNMGRYGDGKKLRADTPAILIGKKDALMAKVLKDTNTSIENAILQRIRDGGLTRKVAIQLDQKYTLGSTSLSSQSFLNGSTVYTNTPFVGENYILGKKAKDIASVAECSLKRGSTLLVEGNKMYNPISSASDLKALQDEVNMSPRVVCFSSDTPYTDSFWGGNSILNVDTDKVTQGLGFQPKTPRKFTNFIYPVFDIAGTKEITGTEPPASPLDCEVYSSVIRSPYSYDEGGGEGGGGRIYYPSETNATRFSCRTQFETVPASKFQESLLTSAGGVAGCVVRTVTLDGNTVASTTGSCGFEETPSYSDIAYKSISSILLRTSPTVQELKEQSANRASQSLPIDAERSVAFVGNNGLLQEYLFSNLFRLSVPLTGVFSEDTKAIEDALVSTLQADSNRLKSIIDAQNPDTLNASSKKVYNLLKEGTYSSLSFDILSFLKSNPETYKKIIDAIYWYNLSDPTSKYQWILQSYLHGKQNDLVQTPGHRGDYEISVLMGKGTPSQLELLFEPELKNDQPKSEQETRYNELRSLLGAKKMTDARNTSGAEFACGAPPDGVEIWKWPQSIMCWLKTILPPKIGPGQCSIKTIGQNPSAFPNIDLQTDANKNGIVDAYEKIQNGSLVLTSESPLVARNSAFELQAQLRVGDTILDFDSQTQVYFELVRLEVFEKGLSASPTKIYDITGPKEMKDFNKVAQYIQFFQGKIPAKNGVATLQGSTKSAPINATFRAKISLTNSTGGEIIAKTSNNYSLLVRSKQLQAILLSGDKTPFPINPLASNNLPIIWNFQGEEEGEPYTPQYPIKLSLYDIATGEKVTEDVSVPKNGSLLQFPFPNQSGVYEYRFFDAKKVQGSRTITILPNTAKELKIVPMSTHFVAGTELPITVQLLDEYGNLLESSYSRVKVSIARGNFIGESPATESVTLSLYEGFTTFAITSKNSGAVVLSAELLESPSLQSKTSLTSLVGATAKFSFAGSDPIRVGGKAQEIQLSLINPASKEVLPISTSALLSIDPSLGTISPQFVSLKNGTLVEKVTFTPKTLAQKNVKIQIAIPGISQADGNEFDILPEDPLYATIQFGKTHLESPGGKTLAKIRLHDQYGNIAWNRSNDSVALSLPGKSQNHLRIIGPTTLSTVDGEATTSLSATSLPGYAQLQATAPVLESTKILIRENEGKTLSINGVKDAFGGISTFASFSYDSVRSIDYNSLVTLLGGASYADITEKNSLASGIVFSPKGRGLGAIGLLSHNPNTSDVFTLTPAGRIQIPNQTGDRLLSVRPRLLADSFASDVFDSARNERIASVHYNFGSDPNLIACTREDDRIQECDSPTGNAILLASFRNGMNTRKTPNGLDIIADKTALISISKNGALFLAPGVQLEFDTQQTNNYLGYFITRKDGKIGYLALRVSGEQIESLSQNKKSPEQSVGIEITSELFGMISHYVGNSTSAPKGIRVVAPKGSGENIQTSIPFATLEKYPEVSGIGFEKDNRMMLEFAAGASLGEAVSKYQSFKTVLIGDPGLRLPSKKVSGYDASIGTSLYKPQTGTIESFAEGNINNDTKKDIVVFESTGNIRALLNIGETVLDWGDLLFVTDAAQGNKILGDFNGDGFDDIALVSKKGELILVQNNQGAFRRIQNPPKFSGALSQIVSYDMDADGNSDIVYSTENGEIGILYGSRSSLLTLTPQIVEKSYGVNLISTQSRVGGAITFDGINTFKENARKAPGVPTDADYLSVLDSQLFVEERFTSTGMANTPKELVEARGVSAFGTDENGNPNTQLLQELTAEITNSLPNGVFEPTLITRETVGYSLRSQFAEAAGFDIQKSHQDRNGGFLQRGDTVDVTLTIKNTSSSIRRNIRYLDSFEKKLFTPKSTIFQLEQGEKTREMSFIEPTTSTFDLSTPYFDMLPGQTATIRYSLTALPIKLGKFQVGDFEKGEPGADIYGDILLDNKISCGEDYQVWRSTALRSYASGVKSFQSGTQTIPDSVQKQMDDTDGNGIPDAIEKLTQDIVDNPSDPANLSSLTSQTQNLEKEMFDDGNGNGVSDRLEYDYGSSSAGGLNMVGGQVQLEIGNSESIDAINSGIDSIITGLGCGFGGGGCFSFPVNYAPLAPGSVPSLFGFPLGKLTPSTGMPIFSSLTTMRFGRACIPAFWPLSPLGPGCSGMGIGGAGGTSSPINGFRLYVTPTITGSVGVAACYGGPSIAAGNLPPPGTPPLPGNCVVAAKPLSLCKDDGSDGNYKTLGKYSTNNFTNTNSCVINGNSRLEPIPESVRKETVRYLQGNSSSVKDLTKNLNNYQFTPSSGPLISIGQGSGGGESNFDLSLDFGKIGNGNPLDIVKIKNSRVSDFPDFIMGWVDRQLEEVVNKLTSLPTLYVILPDMSKARNISDTNYLDALKKSYNEGIAGSDNASFDIRSSAKVKSETAQTFQKSYNDAVSGPAANIQAIGKNISGIQATYEYISKLPLINLETEQIDLTIPWFSPEDLDRTILLWKKAADQWQREIDSAQKDVASLESKEGVSNKVLLDASATLSSLRENIRMLEEYRKFPDKLFAYMSWKERYANDLLCNIDTIDTLLGGWISNNGMRFRTWVEFYLLLKALLKSWQPIPDLFTGYRAECAPCRNERYNLKHFIFKIVSALIPQIPIIQFPKWPDIWIDLHSIRTSIDITLPEFSFRTTPLILPKPPSLLLPRVPGVAFSLPSIPVLPKIPPLPPLPDLPSLPSITLPDLPPPPKIPKLFGGVAAFLNVLKLIKKILCIMETNPFVPEWRAGEKIAQITERTGKLPIDFLNVQFPNFSFAFIDAIRVNTFINLQFSVDFIVEMARATVEPINSFGANTLLLSPGTIPSQINLDPGLPQTIDLSPTSYQSNQSKNPSFEESAAGIALGLAKIISGGIQELQKELFVGVHTTQDVAQTQDSLRKDIASLKDDPNPKVRAIYATISQAIDRNTDAEDAFIAGLQENSREKFDTLRSALKQEIQEAKMQGEAIRKLYKNAQPFSLQSGVSASTLPISGSHSLEPAKKYFQSLSDGIIQNESSLISELTTPDTEYIQDLQDRGNAIKTQMREALSKDAPTAFAQANDLNQESILSEEAPTVAIAADTNNTTNQIGYTYRGIYYTNEAGEQTRLFNYTDLLSGDETPYEWKIRNSGTDLLYIFAGSLYKKYSGKTFSEKFQKSSVLNGDIETETHKKDGIPYSTPNYFTSVYFTPKKMQLSYAPASINDALMRFEYFEEIDRFQRIDQLGLQNRNVVDLISQNSKDVLLTESLQNGISSTRQEITILGGIGEGYVTYPKYTKMLPGSSFRISPGSIAYTLQDDTQIRFLSDGDSQESSISLPKYSQFQAINEGKITVLDGAVLLILGGDSKGILPLSSLSGFPALPGISLLLENPNAKLKLRYFDDQNNILSGKVSYTVVAATDTNSDGVQASIPSENGFFHGVLSSIRGGIRGTQTSQVLFAPQLQSDTTQPIFSFPSSFRIPIFTPQSLPLSRYVFDISGIASFEIQHSNDVPVTLSQDGVLSIPSASKPGKRVYTVRATDTAGNVSSTIINLDFYTPDSQLTNVSEQSLTGSLSEKLSNIPIHVYRLRSEKTLSLTGMLATEEQGLFSSNIAQNRIAEILDPQSQKQLATLSQKTGILRLSQGSPAEIRIQPTTPTSPLTTQVVLNGKVIYEHSFALASSITIRQTPLPPEEYGIWLTSSSLQLQSVPLSAKNIPGGYYLTQNKKPILGISKDGQIYTLEKDIVLRYRPETDYFLYEILQGGESLGSLSYRLDSLFVEK